MILSEHAFSTGIALQADVTLPATFAYVQELLGPARFAYIGADPPYGGVVAEDWDRVATIVGDQQDPERAFTDWMISWVRSWSTLLADGGAFYVWGGVGRYRFRPFYQFLHRVEHETSLTLVNHITWKKKRGYGTLNNYLFTREEIAFLSKGKPSVFHIPLLPEKRGYAGYNRDYPAKSEFKRRSNVWKDTDDWDFNVWDETEILRGKRGPCQKAPRVNEIPLETHTNQGDLVLDLFAGTGSLSRAALLMGRLWIAIEKGEAEYQAMVNWLDS